jgi:hypothetical protein
MSAFQWFLIGSATAWLPMFLFLARELWRAAELEDQS